MPIALENASFSLAPASGRRSPPRAVLRDVTLTLVPGRVLAVLGPNGAGKTTLLRMIAGLLAPTSGSVALDAREVSRIAEPERARRVALVPQRSDVAFAFTVRTYASFGLHAAGTSGAALVDRALGLLELADRAGEAFADLSAGQQQRATLARALIQLRAVPGAPIDPDPTRVLLADEPASAMDPRHAARSLDALSRVARAGLAVVVVLHDFTLAARHADDALLLDATGRVRAQGPARAVLAPAPLREVFGIEFVRTGENDDPTIVPARAPIA